MARVYGGGRPGRRSATRRRITAAPSCDASAPAFLPAPLASDVVNNRGDCTVFY